MGKIDQHFSRELVWLDRSAGSREAARLMRERKIGAVAVRDAGHIIGLVSERDLVTRLLAGDGNVDRPLGEVMQPNLPRVEPNATESECARLMRDHNTRHLLVVAESRVVGIISMRDVIQLMLDEKQELVEQLQSYIMRS